MKIKKTLLGKFSLVAFMLLAGLTGAGAENIRITLSDGSSLELAEPVDVMGLTWKKVKDHMPAVFFIVDREGMTDDEKITQLLSTVNSVGQLYVRRYDRAVTGDKDDADMYVIEDRLAKIKSGEGNDADTRAVLQGEAVSFWGAMLEDKAEEIGINPPRSMITPSGEAFLNEYARALENGENVDIYTESFINVERSNPSAFSSYLKKATPERRARLEKIAVGTGVAD